MDLAFHLGTMCTSPGTKGLAAGGEALKCTYIYIHIYIYIYTCLYIYIYIYICKLQDMPLFWCTNKYHKQHRTQTESPIFWHPLGFHPAWHKCINKALAKFNCDEQFQRFWKFSFGRNAPRVRVAWCNQARPLFQSFPNI